MVIEYLTASVLTLTLIAIIWYAWETRGMKKQIVRQNDLALRPFIVLAFEASDYFLINISRVPALNIKLEDIRAPLPEFDIHLSFDPVDVLCSGEKKKIVIRNEKGIEASDLEMGFIWPRSAKNYFYFEIKYQSIENQKYLTFGKMGKGGVEISGTKNAPDHF